MTKCGKELDKWNKDVFGRVDNNIKKEQQKLAAFLPASDLELGVIETCKKYLNELLIREELMWKQRFKEFYIKEGDKNTKFFHLLASKIRRNNGIMGIQDEQGI